MSCGFTRSPLLIPQPRHRPRARHPPRATATTNVTRTAQAAAEKKGAAEAAGFSLHAGIGIEAAQRGKLERLARYVRPRGGGGRAACAHRAPLDFLARLAALVPPPRAHLTRWMQKLKRVFAIDIEHCCRCGGKLTVIASIEEPALIERILARVRSAAEHEEPAPFAARAPPQPRLL